MDVMNAPNIYTITFDLSTIPFNFLKKVNFKDIKGSIIALNNQIFIDEVAIIQKCNSCELVIVTDKEYSSFEKIISEFWIKNSIGLDLDLWKKVKVRVGREAIEHILRTSCGLKSIIPGDNQVVGQVRRSFSLSKELGAGKEIFDIILHFCRKNYTEIEKRTEFYKGNLSVGRAAVDLLKKDNVQKVLVFGAGEIAEVVINSLYQSGFDEVFIANRTVEKAKKLANKKEYKTINFEEALKKLDEFDVVICSTSKQGLIKLDGQVFSRLKVLIDLGNPENVNLINKSSKLTFFNLESIRDFSQSNLLKRKNEIGIVEDIVSTSTDDFFQYLEKHKLESNKSANILFVKERLRNSTFQDILRFRSSVIQSIRNYLNQIGFLELNFPAINIVATDPVKSNNELFLINWYGKKAFLAQSVQLHKQMSILSGFEKIYSINNFWREEQISTPRHLAEALALDVEFRVDDYRDLMKFTEDLIAHLSIELKNNQSISEEIRNKILIPKTPFRKITYSQAIDLLKLNSVLIEYGEDIGYERELKLCEIIKREFGDDLFFIIDYPNTVKKFYTMEHLGDKTKTFDLLYRGWEIISGAQRENRLETLKKKITDSGLSTSEYSFYLSLFDENSPQHGGFGMGLDRFIAKIIDLNDVREVVQFPRTQEMIAP